VAHVIFPRGLTAHQALYAANRLVLPSAEDPVSEITALLAHQPPHFDDRAWDAVLGSHVIDRAMCAAVAEGDRERFLALRQELIRQQLSDFLDRMAEWDFEDTPALDSLDFDAIDELDGPAELEAGQLF